MKSLENCTIFSKKIDGNRVELDRAEIRNKVCGGLRKRSRAQKEYGKEYRLENRELISAKKKKYYQENRDTKLVQMKQYYHETRYWLKRNNTTRRIANKFWPRRKNTTRRTDSSSGPSLRGTSGCGPLFHLDIDKW